MADRVAASGISPRRRTGRAFGTVLAALGEVEAFLLVPLRVVKHAEVVAGRDGGAVALTRVDVVDVVEVALEEKGLGYLSGLPALLYVTHADGVVQSDGADARKEWAVILRRGGRGGDGHEEQRSVKPHDGDGMSLRFGRRTLLE